MRAPSESTISAPSIPPQRSSPSTWTRTQRPRGLQMGSIFVDLPAADGLDVELPDLVLEPLHLEALHGEEGVDQLRPDGLRQPLVRLERIERGAEVRGQRGARVRL